VDDKERLKSVLWRLLRPVLVAVIVAFLTALGVSVEVARQQQVSVAGVTHFSSVYSNDDVQSVDDLIVGDDASVAGDLTVVGSASYTSASVTVPFVDTTAGSFRIDDPVLLTGTLAIKGPISDQGTTFMVNDNALVTGTLGVSGAGTVGGALGVTGAATFAGAASIGTLLTLVRPDAGAAITVTTNGYITPTTSYVVFAAVGNVFTANMAVLGAGKVVVFVNGDSDTVTITDTSTTMLSATYAMGQYDVLGMISDGTNMIEIFRTNN
jgi:hypothetical protein